MSQEDTASENSFQPPANATGEPDANADAKPGTKPEPNTIDYNDIIENISSEMISFVSEDPRYVQCLLHIKAYRDYHRGEKEEFNERIEVLDERYKTYTTIIDSMQIMIIVFSAVAAFIQAGNSLFSISDNVLRFIGLCVSSWTALSLSIAKYYKLDEQKENMNNLRHQCADLVSELGAREDRLNTLCAKEIWAGPPGAPTPPAVTAWENERDEMYNSLKTMIQKKQSLVAVFDQIMDSQESKKLILASKNKSLSYKKEKLKLDKKFLEYAKEKNQHNEVKMEIDGRKHKRRVADMSRMQPNGMFNARSAAPVTQIPYNSAYQRRGEMYNDRDRADDMRVEMRRMARDFQEELYDRDRDNENMKRHIQALVNRNTELQGRLAEPKDEETGHAEQIKKALQIPDGQRTANNSPRIISEEVKPTTPKDESVLETDARDQADAKDQEETKNEVNSKEETTANDQAEYEAEEKNNIVNAITDIEKGNK